MVYLTTIYVYHDDDYGYRYGAIVEAPSEETAKDYTESLMQDGDPPFWPESFADHIQFDSGAIEFAPDVGNLGMYYNFAYDQDIQKEAYDEAIAAGLDEEDAQEKVWNDEAGRSLLGIEPQEQRTFKSKQAALDWLEREGLYPPHRVKEAVYPWEENPHKSRLDFKKGGSGWWTATYKGHVYEIEGDTSTGYKIFRDGELRWPDPINTLKTAQGIAEDISEFDRSKRKGASANPESRPKTATKLKAKLLK